MLNQKISVFLADDNLIVREGLRHGAIRPYRVGGGRHGLEDDG